MATATLEQKREKLERLRAKVERLRALKAQRDALLAEKARREQAQTAPSSPQIEQLGPSPAAAPTPEALSPPPPGGSMPGPLSAPAATGAPARSPTAGAPTFANWPPTGDIQAQLLGSQGAPIPPQEIIAQEAAQAELDRRTPKLTQAQREAQEDRAEYVRNFAAELGVTTWGELTGRAIGSAVGGFGGPIGVAVANVLGGAIGGTAALAVYQMHTQGQVDVGDLALQFGVSLGLGSVVEGLGDIVRKGMAATREGAEAGVDVLAPGLKDKVRKIVNPMTAGYEDAVWKLTRESGLQMSPTSFTKGMREGLSAREWKRVSRELLKIGEGPGGQFPNIGEKAVEAFNAIRAGNPAPGMDIGALNHIRSQLTSAIIGKQGGDKAGRRAVEKFTEIISDGINNGRVLRMGKLASKSDIRAAGQGLARGERRQLMENMLDANGQQALDLARKTTRQIKVFENVAGYLDEKVITKTDNLKHFVIKLKPLDKILDKENYARLAPRDKQFVDALKANPLIESEMKQFIKAVDEVIIDPGIISKQSVVEFMSFLMLAPRRSARERAMRIFMHRKGKVLTPNDLIAAGLNAVVGRGASVPETREAVRGKLEAIRGLVY